MSDDTCNLCGERPGARHVCPGDDKLHWHGLVHRPDGGLAWLCGECAACNEAAWREPAKPEPLVIQGGLT
jgi:hypothetical protein